DRPWCDSFGDGFPVDRSAFTYVRNFPPTFEMLTLSQSGSRILLDSSSPGEYHRQVTCSSVRLHEPDAGSLGLLTLCYSPMGCVMANVALDPLLPDSPEGQFWLKPIGPPQDHPDWNAPEHRTWSHSPIEVHFSRNPVRVAVGAIIIAYRVRYQKLIYVA